MFLFFSAFIATAQTNPPPASYVRSYVNDLPDQPLVTVTVTGAVNVACFTIEEILPGAASAHALSDDGVFLPVLGVVRWGPYTNTVAATVSYRLSGPSGTYPVGGGAWMDGQWYFSPGVTMVNVLPPFSNEVPPPPLQLPAPVFMPPSGADVPVNVVIGMPGSVMNILDDTWQEGIRNIQEPPYQSAWFVSGSATNLTTATNALTLWPASGLLGIINLNANIYGDPSWGNATYPVSLAPGNWLFQLVSPDTYPGATYWAWIPNPSWGSWFTTYGIYSASGVYVGSGGMGAAGATAHLAFTATTNAGADVTLITLTNPATLHLGVGDGIISDNLGGVSVRITRPSPVVGISYFSQRSNASIAIGVGDSLRATLRFSLSDQALVPSAVEPGLRVGLFNFSESALPQKWVTADGFDAGSQGDGVNGYALFQRLGSWPSGQPIVNIRTRTNVLSSDLMGNIKDYASMTGSVTSNNFPAFVPGRDYVLTLALRRVTANSLSFTASWLDTVSGGVLVNSATNLAATNFNFDGLAIRTESSESTATNITFSEFKVEYLPKAISGLPDPSGAEIRFTLDGTTPTSLSTLYTGAVHVAASTVIRARAFSNGWTPSAASVAYYGQLDELPETQVTRSVNADGAVSFGIEPAANASCWTLAESLGAGLTAVNITGDGQYVASNNAVLWGPFFGTNAQTLSYQAVGTPGTYPVRATWSTDGVGGGEPAETNIVLVSAAGSGVPTPPPQVVMPVFTPASGSNVPVNVSISCATPGAVIYYTLDGSVPTTSSLLYTGEVNLVSAGAVRARAFTNGWTPSVAGVAYYGMPAVPVNAEVIRSVNTNLPTSPMVTLSVVPGTNAACFAVTELLPSDLSATSVTAGGNYIASNNVVVWGPFFGTNEQTLSYKAVGQPGTYQTRATWSVDGVSASDATAANIVIASTPGSGFPTPPPQAPMPTLSPSNATNLPVSVSISSSDSQAQIYFTTDGTLPTLSSTPYTTPLAITTQTALRARAFRTGYLPSVAASGEYVPLFTTNSLLLVRSVVGNGTFIPSVTVTATPSVGMNCYSVTETVAPGLTPSGLSADAVWNPSDKTVRWGPYLDNQQRSLTYNLFSASSGAYPLSGQGSFDGFPSPATGATIVTVNAEYSGSPNTNFPACVTAPITYNLNFNPNPGIILIDSVSGTLNWGDGTQVVVTQAVMTLQKVYATSGVYTVTLSADWIGHTIDMTVSGHATKTDTINAVTQCNPVILVQPQPTNQLVLVGATAQISVNATSIFPMSYQWYFNLTNPIVSPSTFQMLTLENVRPEADGFYSVLIANAYGSVTSSVARLNVMAPLIAGINPNPDGSVTLNFVGLPNSTNRIWVATNLAPPVTWQVLSTIVADSSGQWLFTETNAMS